MSHVPDVWRGVNVDADWVMDRMRIRREMMRVRVNRRCAECAGILRDDFIGIL
jgi:hypothetical protein